eukprot:SAG31_NODE_17119_length_682_cov_1.897084_2_plen_28_part_01
MFNNYPSKLILSNILYNMTEYVPCTVYA